MVISINNDISFKVIKIWLNLIQNSTIIYIGKLKLFKGLNLKYMDTHLGDYQ